MKFKEISSEQAVLFLLPRHYSGRKPNISIAFGWFSDNDELKAVCTFGKPASHYLCTGVCGDKWSKNVYELNRLCRTEDLQEQLSQFVALCLKELKKKNWIVVSYSDTQMHHHGYIYQACNFIYTGCTRSRTDMYTGTGKRRPAADHPICPYPKGINQNYILGNYIKDVLVKDKRINQEESINA